MEHAGSLTGLDVEPLALEVARRNVPGAAFVEGSVFELPFADGSFDAVTMFEVLEHIPVGTEREAFAEIARVLAPGGALMLTTPSWTLRSRLLDPAYLVAGHRHYRASDVVEMLCVSELRTERTVVRGGWVYVATISLSISTSTCCTGRCRTRSGSSAPICAARSARGSRRCMSWRGRPDSGLHLRQHHRVDELYPAVAVDPASPR